MGNKIVIVVFLGLCWALCWALCCVQPRNAADDQDQLQYIEEWNRKRIEKKQQNEMKKKVRRSKK